MLNNVLNKVEREGTMGIGKTLGGKSTSMKGLLSKAKAVQALDSVTSDSIKTPSSKVVKKAMGVSGSSTKKALKAVAGG